MIRLLERYRARTRLGIGIKALALRVLQPRRQLVRRTAQQAIRLQKQGDLRGALAVYDSLPGKLWERSEIQVGRRQVLRRLQKQAAGQARELRDAGQLAEVLALYDGLPVELRDDPDIVCARARAHELLRKRTEQARKRAGKDIQRLRRGRDWVGALAVIDALPAEMRESAEIREAHNELLELVVAHAQKEARRLRRAGDIEGALAVLDRVPPELRERTELLAQRTHLLHELGRLDAAAEMARKVVAMDPTNSDVAKVLGDILKDFGRTDDLRAIIADMVSSKPPTFDVLVQAAEMAKAGDLAALADKLLDQAVSMRATATPGAIVRTARILLNTGAQGQVIDLLRSETVRTDPSTRDVAHKLTDAALAQLHLAGSSAASGSVDPTERADVHAFLSILAEYRGSSAARSGVRRGIAIVIGGLGPNGAQGQTAELVRQICSLPRETVGPIFLLVLSRSRSGPEFYADRLAGLDATVEFLSDFEIDARQSLPADVVVRLGFLPKLFDQTICLTDRLKAHSPEVVLAMSDGIGLVAMLAASLAGTPRVVVSARTVPPSERERSDVLMKPVYRAAIAYDRIALVTNASRTAQSFVEWLGTARRVGVIHNGIDVDRLLSQRDPAATAAQRSTLGIAENARIVGSVFGGRRQKRPRFWIEAAAVVAKRAPDVVFIIVGDKLQGDEVSAAIAEFGLQDRFHRPGIRSDVPAWLDLMDVFLLTSEVEGTPNVLLEAQALGLPVVATDVGGSAECFLAGETGVLLSADPTPEQVADAVLGVLEDAGFAARARDQGPALIRQRFDPKRMASEYRAVLFGNGRCLDDEPRRATA